MLPDQRCPGPPLQQTSNGAFFKNSRGAIRRLDKPPRTAANTPGLSAKERTGLALERDPKDVATGNGIPVATPPAMLTDTGVRPDAFRRAARPARRCRR